MLRIGAFCFLFVVQTSANAAFQNWCFGQQRPPQPITNIAGNLCNPISRSYTSPCGARQPAGTPVGYPQGYPSYPSYPSGGYWPVGAYPGQQQQQQQSWPWPWQVVSSRPIYPSEPVTESVKVVVPNPYYPAQKVLEWVCPTDPEPRARSTVKENEPELRECIYDENCPSAPIRQKCCYDTGIGGKVCKPAIPI